MYVGKNNSLLLGIIIPPKTVEVNVGGIELKIVFLTKIRYYAEIAPNLPFTEYDFYEEYRGAFAKTVLRRAKSFLPLRKMWRTWGA